MNYFFFSIFRTIIYTLLVLGIIVNFIAPFFYFYIGIYNVLFCIFSGIILLLTLLNLAADKLSESLGCAYFVIIIWSNIFGLIQHYEPSFEDMKKENIEICKKMLGRNASEIDIMLCAYELIELKAEAELILIIIFVIELLLYYVIYRFYYICKLEALLSLIRNDCETPPSYGTINANVPNPDTRDDSAHDRIN
ncbi:unnamed protein product [Rhizophagus irregularis]|uniref:Uncharacterized protein n=1 Tax=Rhizophagus irregularis TaxID=588596 RepID=A0A2N1NML5_9GLOM|nr:hypothetical protein RhiirC2_863439 [Rhizophagus irregularis]CAB4378617.1 unnamed protein product [Rhizophagus irregularis]CAB5369996.1 unnamed protein product [Rhizophagus irregularis]